CRCRRVRSESSRDRSHCRRRKRQSFFKTLQRSSAAICHRQLARSLFLSRATKGSHRTNLSAGTVMFTGERISEINISMSTQELITEELNGLPEPLQREVYDFIRFLREKSAEDQFNGLLLSESALKDWESPEEDAAWAN